MSNPSHGAHAEVHIHEHSDVGGIGYGLLAAVMTSAFPARSSLRALDGLCAAAWA